MSKTKWFRPAAWPEGVASCPVRLRRAAKWTLLLTLVPSLFACGHSSTGPGSTAIGAKGGTVSLAGGAITLSVPPGALDTTVEFTADSTTSLLQPDLVVSGSVYELGPAVTFSRLATLKVAYDPGKVPPGVRQAELEIQSVQGDGWSPAVGSSIDSSTHVVSGKIDALGTAFGVVAVPAASVTVYPAHYNLRPGETTRLSRSIYGAAGESLPYRRVTWTSGNEDVATVDTSGLVTGVGTGSDTITASVNGRTATASVLVFDCSAQDSVPAGQCAALVDIFDAYAGTAWRTSSLRVTDPCGWRGVTCAGGSVSALSLEGSKDGSISSKVGELTGLDSLEIWSTGHLAGGIPSFLGSLPKLQVLSITGSGVLGSIPPELGQLSNLRELDLDGDSLSGPIPPELGNLSRLTVLRLDNNPLTGSIPPELGKLSSLVELDVFADDLAGSIPRELGQLTNLERLSLGVDQLSGSIPTELGNLSNLTFLALTGTQVSGAIPAEIGNLAKLDTLDLFGNDLTGTVPLSVAQLGGKLQSRFGVTACLFVTTWDPGNTGLSIPDTQDYRDADLDGDGRICGLTIGGQ